MWRPEGQQIGVHDMKPQRFNREVKKESIYLIFVDAVFIETQL